MWHDSWGLPLCTETAWVSASVHLQVHSRRSFFAKEPINTGLFCVSLCLCAPLCTEVHAFPNPMSHVTSTSESCVRLRESLPLRTSVHRGASVAVCCSVLQCVALCCSVLLCAPLCTEANPMSHVTSTSESCLPYNWVISCLFGVHRDSRTNMHRSLLRHNYRTARYIHITD